MSVERRGENWRVRWRAGGTNHSRTFTDKASARRFDEEIGRAKSTGGLRRFVAEVEGGEQPLGQVFSEWWEQRGPELSPKTRTLYRWLANKFILPRFGAEPVGAITTRDVEAWLAAINTGPTAKRKAASLLSQVFNAARRWGYVAENPVEIAKRPKAPARKAVRPPTPVDCERIRAWFLKQDRHGEAALISMLYMAGLRPVEARHLTWPDVRERTIWVDATKTGRSRAVKMVAPLAADLAAWRLASGGAGLIFPNTLGEFWTESGWSNWRRRVWAKSPGGQLGTPYALRHACASLMIREGLSITEVAEQMGHSSEECLRTYAHVFADLDPSDRRDRETLIRAARAEVFGVREEATG